MIPASGTFDYVGTVGPVTAFPWSIELQSTREPEHPAVHGRAGPHPHLIIDEAGITPNAGYDRDQWRPAVLRARLRLTAGAWSFISRTVAQFHLDLSLVKALQPGDRLYVSLTGCEGIGVSAVRDRQLVFAVGAITAVPLGEGVTARIPRELVQEAEAVFNRHDPTFHFPEQPIEIVIDGQRFVSLRGQCDVGPYEIKMLSGFRLGMPGIAESVAISRRGACSASGASASAQLLAVDGLDG